MREISKNKRNREGFTLVELIVVLVILAILAALLIPALTGYIDRAREKRIIAECREAVVSAQTIESEQYARENGGYVPQSSHYGEVEQLAEVPGKVKTVRVSSVSAVTYLEYENSGITAIYEKGHDPEYYLKDGSRSGSAVNDLKGFKDFSDYLQKGGSGKETDRWKEQLAWMDEAGITELPKVSEEVKKGTKYEDTELYWRPYYIGNKKDGVLVYYANTENMKDSATGEWKEKGNWKGQLVYVNDKVYQYTGSSKDGVYIDGLHKCKSYEEVEAYITSADKQFEEVK